MKGWSRFCKITIFPLAAAALVVFSSCEIYRDMQAGKVPRYEVGKHMGAKVCGACHQEIFQKWSENSRHALTTTAKSFLDFKTKFTNNFMLNAMMGEEMCYACHGSKEVNEGVNCETCHGIASPQVDIMETHAKKFKPGREQLRKADFCVKCHTMKSPITGDYMMSLDNEWQKSEARKKGLTCQGCHMKPRQSKLRYHGFDTVTRNAGIYKGDLVIGNIRLDFPRFALAVENRVTGHAIPATGPSRVLGLVIAFQDGQGVEIHKVTRTFRKRVDLMPLIGLMPNKLVENTQLQSGEVRDINFRLPASLDGRIKKAVISLRFYDVSDEYQGDIDRAHWISQPVLRREVSF